ncbi:alpha-2-macroglobulin family protein [Chelativorans sp. AA-79]|uniref:alpha-2-macroglobulin family protein n=1 Tax=Chelativorans sp. AA-79 TaxID=3028735 RepID=UPI0023F9FC24|nr:alpha-2-macroglobulin family protein [Chelativorans sp. AA-79]WEX08782.1 alpha-2-macroglobulin family protein [Chelativorans sp. AA-79]
MRTAPLFSAVFIALLAFVIPAAAQDTRRIVTTQDSDYFGFDLRSEQELSLDECESACLGDPQCRAFTYNTKARWCFLKSDFGTLNRFPGAIAGKVVTASSAPDIGAPPPLSFVPGHVLQEAERYRRTLPQAAEPGQEGLAALTSAASAAMVNGDARNAMRGYAAAVAVDSKNSELWAELARAATAAEPDQNESRYDLQAAATSAGVIAYELSRTVRDRAGALAALGDALQQRSLFRPAISAYEASLALETSPEVEARYTELRRTHGFRIVDHSIDSDSVTPRVCVQFSEELVKSGVDYAQYMTVDNARSAAIDRGAKELCVSGLEHGQQYRIVVRQGLPSAIGEVIEKPVPLEVYIRDRSPSVRFTGENFVLPTSARRGIPIVSVNTPRAKLSLYRVGDRSLTRILTESKFLRQLNDYEIDEVGTDLGEAVWEGSVEIASELNKDVVASIPVDEVVPERKPGIYMLAAVPEDDVSDDWSSRATQWFLVSDIGLSTFTGDDGISIFARSLETAAPIAGLRVRLLARNNEVLGEAVTDDEGAVRFAPGLARGQAGLSPAAIVAQKGEEDFVFLDMTRAGFDLSDRGVAGRPAPGPLDAFAWTERGIYRAGETVHAAVLLRDPSAEAADDLPLTFIFQRPDGVEERRMVSQSAGLGGYAVDLALPENAMRGTWVLRVHTDPEQAPITEKMFLVEDFVPDRTEFELKAAEDTVAIGSSVQVSLDGRYLYGAPAADLVLEGQLTIGTTREWPRFPGYVFGLEDEEDAETVRVPLAGLPKTDADGKATFDVFVDSVPATTRLLNANVSVQMREAGGRAVERSIDIAIEPEGDMIGLRPEFSGGQVPEGGTASFRIIAAESSGQRIAMAGLKWSLYSIERNYQWYRSNGSWNYEPIISTSLIEEGTVSAQPDSEPQISVPVNWGRYRLEVEGADPGGPVTSVEFDAGWFVEATSTETPDGLEVALDRESYQIGDTAKLKISPRFAGEALVTLGVESVEKTFTAHVPAEGTTIDIPVTEDLGAGAYVTATLIRPGEEADNRLPMRAIGTRWLKVDPGERKLSVDLTLPEKVRPNETLRIPVSVEGLAADEEAYVTVAAVDVGILNLTRYEAPDPAGWYFGQRMLGVEMRDIYGRLIDGSLGAAGRLRTGGDGGGMTTSGSPPTEKLLAFFSGVVRLDDQGKAEVSFDLPQFSGTARIMGVAWSKAGIGSATKDIIIRDPVVLTTSLPRFMAPGDQSRLLLEIANTDGPAGDYTLSVTGGDAVEVDTQAVPASITLAAGGNTSLSLPLSAGEPGVGSIALSLSHESGLRVEKSLAFPVRPGTAPVTTRQTITLAANGGSLKIDGGLLGGSFVEGSSVAVNVSRAEAFDIPALLMSLDRYPYGCAEQTTSRALPLLYVSELSKAAGIEDDPALKGRIHDAIKRVLSFQSSSGSFGLWGPGSGDLWLDAYVSDFLTRAREQGFAVPDLAMNQALQNLQNSLAYDTDVAGNGNEIAYAHYVLARNRRASAGDLRYYVDTRLDEFATPIARAQLAAALALYGDVQRAETAFGSALRLAQSSDNALSARSDYGSALRDGAAMLALAAESRPEPVLVPQMISLVSEIRSRTNYLSTQDEAWMLLAARALKEASSDISLAVDGAPHSGAFAHRLSGEDIAVTPITVANRGAESIDAIVTVVASPQVPLPAGGDGFTIKRTYYRLDGAEANVSEARQNERFVAVLEITEDNAWPSRVLVSDLLPAGFEIDNPRLVDSAQLENFEWLGEIDAVHTEFRDDRFIAAFDRDADSERSFRLAYVVRAVAPGIYIHPAASVEDMYRPQLSARTATGFMEIKGK